MEKSEYFNQRQILIDRVEEMTNLNCSIILKNEEMQKYSLEDSVCTLGVYMLIVLYQNCQFLEIRERVNRKKKKANKSFPIPSK